MQKTTKKAIIPVINNKLASPFCPASHFQTAIFSVTMFPCSLFINNLLNLKIIIIGNMWGTCGEHGGILGNMQALSYACSPSDILLVYKGNSWAEGTWEHGNMVFALRKIQDQVKSFRSRLYSFKKDRFFISIFIRFYIALKAMRVKGLIRCCRAYLLGVSLVRAWNRRKTDGIDRIMTLLRSLVSIKYVNSFKYGISYIYQSIVYVNNITQCSVFTCSIISNKLKALIINTYEELYIIILNRPFNKLLSIYQSLILFYALISVKVERFRVIVNLLTFQRVEASSPRKICGFFATSSPITTYKLESYLRFFYFLIYRYRVESFKVLIQRVFVVFKKGGARGVKAFSSNTFIMAAVEGVMPSPGQHNVDRRLLSASNTSIMEVTGDVMSALSGYAFARLTGAALSFYNDSVLTSRAVSSLRRDAERGFFILGQNTPEYPANREAQAALEGRNNTRVFLLPEKVLTSRRLTMREYCISASDHVNHISEKLKFLNLTIPELIGDDEIAVGCSQIMTDIINNLQELYEELDKAPTIWYGERSAA